MSDNSSIEWTDATWGPVVGCTKVSPGCDHCYAETFVNRFAGRPAFPNRFDTVTLRPQFLELPLRWKKPRRIFVNSLADLFHDDVPDGYIGKVFAVMAQAPQHQFQLLTKRHGRMRALLNKPVFRAEVHSRAIDLAQSRSVQREFQWPLRNVWMGVSVENQQWADIRIPALLETPAVVRWISAEPLLGPVDLGEYVRCGADWPGHECDGCTLDWVVAGGESGPGARPMQTEWAQRIVDDCRAAGVPAFVKQLGTVLGGKAHHDIATFPAGLQHREYPTQVPA